MSYYVVIPARYASSRLPGKPLVVIEGKPMVQWVYEQACKSGACSVVVATDDRRVYDAVTGFGGEALMTSTRHESGTDRLQEVAELLALDDQAVIVNVQGDEPLISPRAIDQVANNLKNTPSASIATLCEPMPNPEEVVNPNFVKVVRDNNDFALYFSRATIPWDRDGQLAREPEGSARGHFRHIGLYAYRVALLHQFVQWPMGNLETIEKLEQLRVLENGHRIHVDQSCEPFAAGVDTPEDLTRVQKALRRLTI